MSEELHIASFIVQARVEYAAAVIAAVAGLPGAETAASEGGRLVVLVEAGSHAAVMAAIDCVRELPGVLAVNLVYHHAEPRTALLEDIAHAPDPT